MSDFKKDLYKERILSSYLDDVYSEIRDNESVYNRVDDKDNQNKGIDLEITHKQKKYLIDEKAQLSYLNRDLLTFVFELSYLKGQELKKGWFIDSSKITDKYFLITGIYLKVHESDFASKHDIKTIKITSVNKRRLKTLLNSKGLTDDVLIQLTKEVRKNEQFGDNPIEHLNPSVEGSLYYSKHLTEKPVNLKLYLSFLINNRVAKTIYPKGE